MLGIAQLMVALDLTIVNIALPNAQADLHFSNGERQWIVTAYSLAFGSLLLPGGRLADTFGRKRLLVAGVIGFAAASAIGGAAVDFPMLAVARALQGVFAALLAPAALSLLATTFTHPDERGKAFGIYSGIAVAGASFGLLVGGLLTQYLNWRFTMYVNVVFAAVAAIGGLVLLSPHAAEMRQRIDRGGTLLAGVGLFATVYGLAHAATKSGSAGWTDPQTLGPIIGGVILLTAFVAVERRAPHPLLPVRVVLDRNRGGAYIAMFLASIGLFGVFLFLTYYLETILGYSPVRTGLAFVPMTAAVAAAAGVVNTVLMPRISPRLLVPAGLLMAAVGLALITRIGLHSPYGTTILPPLLLVAVGLGLLFGPCFSLGTLGVAGYDAGVASATVNVAQQIGGSVGTALLNSIATSAAAGYIAAHATGRPTPLLVAQASVHSYTTTFAVSAAVFAAAAVVVAALLPSGIPDLAANETMEEPQLTHER